MMPPSALRVAEVVMYTVLSTVPFVLLGVYPFRQQYRFPRGVTIALLVLVTAVQICLRTAAACITVPWTDDAKAWCTGLSSLLYAAVYFLLIHAHPGKLLFTLLMLSNIAALAVIDAKCLEGLLFGQELARQSCRWTASAAMAPVLVLLLVPLFLYFRRCYAPAVHLAVGKHSWRYLWLVPATFYLLWFCFCYGSVRSAMDIALDPASAGLTLLVNLGGFLIYHMVILLIDEMGKNEQLTARNYQLTVQSLQLDSLNRQIAATRRARHDMRHHMAMVDSYLTAGEYDKLHEYLCAYRESLQEGGGAAMCANSTVNASLAYFRQMAETYGVKYAVSADVPARSAFPEQILTVLLGNLLENAVDACRAVSDGGAYVAVTVKETSDALFVQVENTCASVPVRDKDGTFFSTKHEGKGIGLASVQAITEQYEGAMTVETGSGRFCVAVLLNKS